MYNLIDKEERRRLVRDIGSDENKARKQESFKQSEVYNGRLEQYVIEHLLNQYTEETLKEIPIQSNINLTKRIADQSATVYKEAPERRFTDLSDDEKERVNAIYRDAFTDAKMNQSNVNFKSQSQSLLYTVPVKGKIEIKVLRAHHYDVIQDYRNPEIAGGYVISVFDRRDLMVQGGSSSKEAVDKSMVGSDYASRSSRYTDSDQGNQDIAENEDYRAELERYLVWTPEYNFTMNGLGEIVDDESLETREFDEIRDVSPLKDLGIMPFVDVAGVKDFEYFVRQGTTLTDFTIQFNSILSEVAQSVKMSGWAQAWLKADANLKPQNINLGPNSILHLPIDPDTGASTDFGYASPNSDIRGSLDYVKEVLSYFLTSMGIDPKTVSGSGEAASYTSGIERLLALFEKFDATREDFEIYRGVEIKLYDVIKGWVNTYTGTEFLLPEYSGSINDDSRVFIEFSKPTSIKSDADKLDEIERQLDLKLISQKDAIQEWHGLDEEEAENKMKEIEAMEGMNGVQGTEVFEIRSESDV